MTQPDPTQPVVTSTSTPAADAATPPTAPVVKEGDVKSLPDWAQTLVSNLRGEAANWRTQLREAQDALGKAKTPEDIQKATEEMAAKNAKLERDLLVERISREHNLPDDLKSRLQGDDEKALRDDAKALAKFAPKPEAPDPVVDPDNLSGGVNPGGDSTESFDPVALAQATRKNRY